MEYPPILSKDDAMARVARSKIGDGDVVSYTIIGANPTDGMLDVSSPQSKGKWTSAAAFGPFNRPVTVRFFITVTNPISISVALQPDHAPTKNNPNGPHSFHDTAQDISSFSGTKIVDIKGADVIVLTPSADAGPCTVIAVPLYY